MFEKHLEQQVKMHNDFGVQDAAKMCYQAAYGVGHIVNSQTYAYFCAEYDKASNLSEEIFEAISDTLYRVNISAWKTMGYEKDWLYKMFCLTAQRNPKKDIEKYLSFVKDLCLKGKMPFSINEWNDFVKNYDRKPISHSEKYKKANNPMYRIIHKDYVNLTPVLDLCKNNRNKKCILSIDGNCAAGKTTLCKLLAYILNAEIIYMDHFFLPPELRTKSRLGQAGGNIHYERFISEVLPYIKGEFDYRIFDCSKMDYGETMHIGSNAFRIVEGSYSQHPIFEDYADIKIFCSIDPTTQIERIVKRDGKEMAYYFQSDWIPMENKYFEEFKIKQKADIIY